MSLTVFSIPHIQAYVELNHPMILGTTL